MTKKEEVKQFKCDLIAEREMFYNEGTMWGVYSFKFANPYDAVKEEVRLHPIYNNFTINGQVFQLEIGEKYTVTFEESYTERYGDGYTFVEVATEGLTKRSAQVEFLNAVLPQGIAQDIVEKNPDNDDLLNSILDGRIDLLDIKRVTSKNVDGYLNAVAEFNTYQEAIVLLAPLGVSINKIQKLSAQLGGSQALIQVINRDIYRLTRFEGFGFKTIDSFALKLGYSKDSKSRILAGAEYVLEQMSTYGDIKIPIESFDKEICKILEVDEVDDKTFDSIISSDKFHYEKGHIALSKYREEELEIASRLLTLLTSAKPLEGFDEAFELAIQEQENKNGFEFTDEQREAISLPKDSGVMVINGVAGSGKSSVTKAIVEALGKIGHSYIAGALSGKAAMVLIQNGLSNSSTIHRMLQWSPNGGFLKNASEPLEEDLVIIDEASMNNNTLFLDILRAIEPGKRLLLIGDNGQLPPIGHGALFEVLLKLNVPRVELTKVHRQAAKSGIITVANEVRHHTQINEYGTEETQVLGELEDMRVFNYIDKTNIYGDLMATLNRFNQNPSTNPKDVQILTAMKKGNLGVPRLNAGAQDILNPHPKGTPLPSITHKDVEFRLGDRVIQNGNFYEATRFENMSDYKLYKKGIFSLEEEDNEGNLYYRSLSQESAVFNGTIGYIVDVDKDNGMLIEFDSYVGKDLIYYSHSSEKSEIGMLDLAYAITVHRSQGSGFNTVLFAFDYSAYMLLSKEFVYTGITRAINHCLMFVENTALHHAIKNTQSSNRKTYVREFLEEELNKLEYKKD